MLESPKKVLKDMFTFSFLKAAILFLVIVLLAWAGYRAWKGGDGEIYGDTTKEVEDFNKRYSDYVDIFKNDTYGGATPQATLNLFIKALEANDPELATLYFMPDDNGSREKWHKVMVDTHKAGRFQEIAADLRKAVPDKDGIIGKSFYRFVARDEANKKVGYVELIFNGKIWKIDGV